MNEFLIIAGVIFCTVLASGGLIYFYIVIVPEMFHRSGKVISVVLATAVFSLLAASALVTLTP